MLGHAANVFKKWDVNCDLKIDVGDVNSVLSAILVERTDDQYDVNNGGAVDVGDVNSVLAEIL